MFNILHVEDSHDWLSTIRGVLEDAGHHVISVDSVLEARSHLDQVDIVICDGNLEHDEAGDGFDLAHELHCRNRRVMVLAAKPRDSFIPFMAKGKFDSDDLIKMIAQL